MEMMALKDRFKLRLKRLKENFLRQDSATSVAQPTTPSITSYPSVERYSTQDEPKVPTTAATTRHILPSLHDAVHQISQPSTELRPVDQGQPIAASLVPCPAVLLEPPEGPVEPSNPALSISEELWNAAYDKISADEGQLVGSYVEILKEVLGGESSETTTDFPNGRKDQTERYRYMRELVKRGRERIETAPKITSKVGSIADFVLSSKGIVDLTIQAVPQAAPAALPWAGVCLALDILRNPSQEMNSNLEGITYVISRMDWYCALTELLPNESTFAHDNAFQEVLSQLKEMIIELYEALLLYQMKSIVYYYRQQGVRILRDMVKLDDWGGDYQHVRDVEASVRTAMDQYYKERTKVHLDELSEHASTLIALLGDIQQDIRGFILEQKAASRDKDDSECRRALRVVDPQDDMTRIENNKDPLLDDVYKWIFETPEYKRFTNWENEKPDSPQGRILWLKGHAGTGKTMLMIGLIRALSNRPAALAPGIAFFFCQGTNSELKTATAVLRSLIWLLLLQQPYLISHLLPKYKISGPSLFTDLNSFIALSEVFRNMLSDDQLSPMYLAIDALDECVEGRADLITLISASFTLSKNVKWLLSSRPEVDILSELRTAETLIELNTECLKGPVKAYIQHKLKHIEGRRGYNDGVLKRISDIVYQKADNTFLWVALAFKALGERSGGYAVKILSVMPPWLSELYEHMMGRIEKSVKLEPSDCKKVLKAVFLAFRPLSVFELSTLTGLEHDIIQDAVEECGSFVIITNQIVNLIHQSAKDYLKDKYGPKRDPDWVALEHANLIEYSIDAISSLEWNIYQLEFNTNPKDMAPLDPDPLAALRYPCVFWIAHLAASKHEQPSSFKDVMILAYKFLKTVFLRWLEILSLLGKVEDGMRALEEFVRLTETEPDMDSNLVEFSKDAYLFFSRNISIIQQAPLQTYSSALIFSPTISLVRKQYWEERKPLVDRKRGFRDRWIHHQTLEGHTRGAMAVTFSPDSRILVSASWGNEVLLYDAMTGAHRQTLNVQECSGISSLAISPSGETLAIGVASEKDHIQLWDMATGVCRLTFSGDTRDVNALAFSPNGNILASASEDYSLRLWHLGNDSICYQTLEGHTGWVETIAFAPNGTLVSGSRDGTIGLWDTATGVRTQTIEPQEGPIFTVAVSPDGHTIASGDSRGALSLWKVADGALIIQSLGGYQERVDSAVFSPDGKKLASAGSQGTVQLWDLTSTTLSCKTFGGHTDVVRAVAFSSNGKMLASASLDETVRLWDVTALSTSSEVPKEQTMAVAISPSGEILASLSECGLLRLWDLATIQPDSKPVEECVIDPSLQNMDRKLYFPHDCTFSPNGRMFAIAWTTGVQVWDLTTTPKTSSMVLSGETVALKFSPDSKFLAVNRMSCTVEVWNLRTTSLEGTAYETGRYLKMGFTPDSTRFVASRDDNEIWLWDQTTAPKKSKETVIERVDKAVFCRDNQVIETTSDHDWNGNVGYSVSADDSWITVNGKYLLRLPVDYQPTIQRKSAIHGSTVVIATKAESLMVIEFL
ncbi:putative NACHT and WD40 domain protein [Rosellinia necatrix]|uniref:Mitochondrial division protein 1 n=1 Tax=Rosellinia necatrix TaxID=77044 RepID=A0A1S7UMF6_ROSNE|nr:putative NACHT and WD40 domain protein [Rosellinia necatrix]